MTSMEKIPLVQNVLDQNPFLFVSEKKFSSPARPLGVLLLLLLYCYCLNSFRAVLDGKGQVHYSQERCLKQEKEAAAADAEET